MGMLNATGCTSVWGSTYPFNPYPFPWANHLFQDAPSLAMGVFEGHMAKMAEGFKAIRLAELELAGEYRPSEHDEFSPTFDWNQFSDEEFHSVHRSSPSAGTVPCTTSASRICRA